MKTSTKIFLGIATVLGIGSYFAYRKINNITTVFQNLVIKVVDFADFRISLQNIQFTIDLYVFNKSDADLSLSGAGAALSRLQIYFKGKYLGEASPQLTAISIPSENELILQNLPVTVSLKNAVNNVFSIQNASASDFSAVATFRVGNREFNVITSND